MTVQDDVQRLGQVIEGHSVLVVCGTGGVGILSSPECNNVMFEGTWVPYLADGDC